jgi:hypothetical protein
LAAVGSAAWLLAAAMLVSAQETGGDSQAATAADAQETTNPDPAAIEPLPGDDRGSGQCGAYLVSWNNVRSFNVATPGSVTLRATDSEGSVVVDLSHPLSVAEKVIPRWCGDILGDGTQALGLEDFSGGAHCCFSASVVLLQPGGRHLLDVDLGNGGLGRPEQLEHDGPLQLPADSDVFAYFDDLSFAASPFLPQVFAYDGVEYVESTRKFPDMLHADVQRAEADLTEAVARPVPAQVPRQFSYQEQKSIALRLYGLHVLLGDAEQALPGIEAHVAPPVASWLAAQAAEAADLMAERYNLDD